MAQKVNILGIKIDNLTLEEALDRVEEIVARRKPEYYCAINLHQIVLYHENQQYKRITDHAGLITADGQPVMWLSKWLKTPLKQKNPGPDFMRASCKMAAEKGYSIFLLGGAPGIAEKAADKLQADYPNLKVAGVYSPPFGFEKDAAEMQRINTMLNASHADLLFVGLGSPKQDIFIDENKDIYQIPLSYSIGIAIDYIGGNIKRAPKWMRDVGLEWLYRFCQDPGRLFKRYFIESWRILKYVITENRGGVINFTDIRRCAIESEAA